MELFLESAWATIAETEREQRKFDANLLTAAKQGNKSFIIKGRGSSVVEQPIRNRQVASSTLALGSKICWVQPDLRGREFRPFSNCAMEMITFTIFATF